MTGQAAWFDCRVKVERIAPAKISHPAIRRQASPVGVGPSLVARKAGRRGIETAPGPLEAVSGLWRWMAGREDQS